MKCFRISDLEKELSQVVEVPEERWEGLLVQKEVQPMQDFVELLTTRFPVVDDDGRECEIEILVA